MTINCAGHLSPLSRPYAGLIFGNRGGRTAMGEGSLVDRG